MKPSSAVEGEQGWPGKEGEGNGGGKEVGPPKPSPPHALEAGSCWGPRRHAVSQGVSFWGSWHAVRKGLGEMPRPQS